MIYLAVFIAGAVFGCFCGIFAFFGLCAGLASGQPDGGSIE